MNGIHRNAQRSLSWIVKDSLGGRFERRLTYLRERKQPLSINLRDDLARNDLEDLLRLIKTLYKRWLRPYKDVTINVKNHEISLQTSSHAQSLNIFYWNLNPHWISESSSDIWMRLNIISVAYIRKAESMKNRLRTDFIDVRNINDLNENECLYTDLISVIFIKILDIRIELYVIFMREIVRIIYKSGKEL